MAALHLHPTGAPSALLLSILLLASILSRAASPPPAPTQEDAASAAVRRFLLSTLPPDSAHYHNLSSSDYINNNSKICVWEGVRCDTEGHIWGLLLESMDLRGSIPASTLGTLSSLTSLSLYNNSLLSPIPDDLWHLPRLRYLSLSRNRFSQPFPPRLSSLSSLQRLDLSFNAFSAQIPSSLFLLPSLHFLFLASNILSGPFPPPISSPSTLAFVDASDNRFSAISDQYLSYLPSLISLNLSRNAISTPFPPSIALLPALSLLDLSHNSIPASIPRLPFPRLLRLANNLLSGFVSPDLFSPHLSHLDLSSNVLSADVSLFLTSSPPSLARLDLSSNNVSGNISLADFSRLLALDYLDLSFNRIAGELPDTLTRAANLSHIDLSNNQISGALPPTLDQLRNLTYLDLSNNSLVGDLLQLDHSPSLLYLNVSYNQKLGCDARLLHRFGEKSFVGVMDCQPFAVPFRGIPPMYHDHRHLHHGMRRWSDRNYLIVGIALGCVLTLAIALLAVAVLLWKKRQSSPVRALSQKKSLYYRDESRYLSGPFSFESNSGPWVANVKNAASVPVIMFEKPLLNLTFADLLRITSNFNRETQVSQGGLGPVYSAILPPGDLHVSIKVLIEGRVLTNEAAAAQFTALSKIKHPNLVPLLGYCIVGEERLVIYEFMKNGGLHRWLMGTPDRMESGAAAADAFFDVSMDLATRARLEPLPETVNLSWPVRHKVALGLARGLAFLHHGQSTKIVHRDVKASNVMLDEEFEPHLANTGLAGLLAGTDDASFARGSPGYVPPEYGQPGGEVTTMGDVFSYGVVLLELVTGKKPAGDSYEDLGHEYGGDFHGKPCANDLVSWVRILMQEKRGLLVQALDPRACEDMISQEQMLDVLKIGYLCTAESPLKRPTIQQVVGLLKDMAPNLCSP